MVMPLPGIRMIVVMVMVMAGSAGADAFDVVVVALLGEADLGLEAQHLLAILAELAVRQVLAVEDLLHALGKGVQHGGVVVQIARLHELDHRVAGGDDIGVVVDALHQDAGEEEIGEHRSEERRVGKAGVSRGRSGWAPEHKKKKKKKKT